MINSSKYHLDRSSPKYQEEIEWFRQSFIEQGVCVLLDFIAPDQLELLVEEANGLRPQLYQNNELSNVFLEPIDLSLPEGHIRRIEGQTNIGVIANDQIPEDSALRQIYDSQHLTDFIGDIVNRGKIYQYACPLGRLNYALMQDSDAVRWHFDLAHFVVTIMIQQANAGGDFEYIHNIKLQDNEAFDKVKDTVNGSRRDVKTLNAPAGSLVLFQGQNTLHRVTPVEGERLRMLALFGYSFEPKQDSTSYVKNMRYGRDFVYPAPLH
ncbi:MAG: hypothetical protein AB8G05_07525 [Oligoflexales bacterium]